MFILLLVPLLTVLIRSPALAAWTPLIAASDFTGIETDVLTTATGIVSIMIIILGIGIIVRTMSR